MESPEKGDESSNLEEYLTIADSQPFLNLLKMRTDYYEEETAKMESVLSRLGLIDERLKMFEECEDWIERLSNLQKKFNLKELTPNAMALSYADKLRKRNNYSAKLKICLKVYIELNEALTKKIKQLQCVYDQSQQKVDSILSSTADEMKTMEQKISRYENELLKLEKKYPWLKNSDYNLPSISREVNLLIAARREKEELQRELDHYSGLKPDLQEASEQLAQVKREYDEINKKLLGN